MMTSMSMSTSPPASRSRYRSAAKLLAGFCASLILASCAATQADLAAPPPLAQPLVAQADAAPEEAAAASSDAEEIVFGRFSEDVLTRSIMAELALQRGRSQEALDYYLELARETHNLSIIERAMRLASYLRNTPVTLELGEMWLAQEPDSTDARQMMAVQLVITSRYREAMEQMEYLLEAGEPIDFRLIPTRLANDQSARLILEPLINDFEALAERHPEAQSVRLSLAMLYEQNDQVPQAYEIISMLAAEQNDDPELVLQEIQLLEKMGEDRKAQRRLERSLRDNPEHRRLRFMYGRKLIEKREYNAAKDQFAILVEQDPRDFEMLYSLALLCMEVNLYDEARTYWQRLIGNGQRLDDAHFYLGYIHVQENRPDQAIEHFLQVQGGNNFPLAMRNLTELMVDDGRYREAHAHLQTMRFRHADYNIPLLSMEADVLIQKEKYDDARPLLDNAINAFPNNIQLLYLRSVLRVQLNDLDGMEQDLRRIILLDPDNEMAYNSLGYTLADRTERYQEAYDLIRRAIELAPNDPAIIDSLGWVQYKLGLLDDARQNLERAYALFPDPEVAAHLGEVYWVMGDKREAERVWQDALETAPNSEFILNAMERLKPGDSI